jgi:flagellar motor switch protein FliM
MKKLLTISFALFLMSFTAGEKEKTVTITMPVSHVDYVLKVLSEKPYKEAAPIIENIYGQAVKQVQDSTGR